jgi:hypothetical protein
VLNVDVTRFSQAVLAIFSNGDTFDATIGREFSSGDNILCLTGVGKEDGDFVAIEPAAESICEWGVS